MINTVGIACEAPVEAITQVQSLTDLDFVIAPYILNIPGYAKRYKEREEGRICILDNGFFEVGYALSEDEILSAAKKVNANYIILPDDEDPLKTREKARKWANLPYQLAVVIRGENAERLARYYATFANTPEVSMICWPFRNARAKALALLNLHQRTETLYYRHHFLGLSSCAELRSCIAAFPLGASLSMDTMKPVSAAFNKTSFASSEELRGKYSRPGFAAAMDTTISHFLTQNIKTLRGAINGLAR